MITVRNDFITITPDDNSYLAIKQMLTFHYSGTRDVFKRRGNKTHKYVTEINETNYVFRLGDSNELIIPTGLGALLKRYFFDYKDERTYTIPFISNIIEDELRVELPEITLRDEQVIAVHKMLKLRRGIVSLGTGGGKTEIACAFISALRRLTSLNVSLVMLEPTSHLVSSTIKRFKKYDIPNVMSWGDHRGTPLNDGEVIISTPQSLLNDMRKNPEISKSIRVIIADECHHASSSSWNEILLSLSNLEYAIGLSATAIEDKNDYSEISKYSFEELVRIGCLGPLCMKLSAGNLVDKGTLAVPVLLRFRNDANEQIPDYERNNWHRIMTDVLRSSTRNHSVVKISSFFAHHKRQVLVLVNTVEWARDLLRDFDRSRIRGVCASYGGGVFEECIDSIIKNTSDGFTKYSNKEVSILIASSHLYEGADLPDLDVIILAFGGRKERIQLQGVGRALRKSKTGKYAYIVDFTDSANAILARQSQIRFDRYISDVGITSDRIYDNILISQLPSIFSELESNSSVENESSVESQEDVLND